MMPSQAQQLSLSLRSPLEDEAPPPATTAAAAAAAAAEEQGRLWQRMKWADAMVRHLIMLVYCIREDTAAAAAAADEAAAGAASSTTTTAATTMKDDNSNQSVGKNCCKKKKGGSGVVSTNDGRQQQLQQKKGKWKSVSKAMLEQGYLVSPQQCEDKFNDLNKRYRRVNELLGRGGAACRVVENHALVDTMDHLTPKAKDEARKLLNSKHLFFREMCAYHSASAAVACNTYDHARQQEEQCLHHPPLPRAAINSGSHDELVIAEDDEEDHSHSYEDDGDDDDDDDDVDVDDKTHDIERHSPNQKRRKMDDDEGESKGACSGAKRARKHLNVILPPLSSAREQQEQGQQLKCELMMRMLAAGGREQQRQWLKKRMAELEEKRVWYQARALELEDQHFKWLRFINNKEREMERKKLENERLSLDNDRQLLLLRSKAVELDLEQN